MSCETIYAFIYRAAQRAEQLWRYLTRRHKRRRPRRSRPSQDTIKDRVSIHERPKTVDGRTEGGHWEGDLIICKRTRPVLVLDERKSRVTLAARLAGKTAAETISVMLLAVFARIEPALRKSITFDNDTAFAQHALQHHRHREFIRFLNTIEEQVPVGKVIHAIVDNCATHKHPKVRQRLTRHPRWTFHFTPTSASWLNAVEGFFAKLTRQRLKRGVFRSVIDLQVAINRFVAETNLNPKPFVWTADPKRVLAAVKRGKQMLESVH